MKAFISHSSQDKHLVRHIATELGDLRCEYDEYSFDYILNVAALRKALSRCSLFVLILSANSITSPFIDEELRAALEARGAGRIKQVVVFAIDDTSYQVLPQWMKEINVAQHLRNAKQIARRIDAYLVELELNNNPLPEFYFGRDEQERELRQALAKPRDLCPIAVHVVGVHGVGRKTFLTRSLAAIAPSHYTAFIPIVVEEYDGICETYRKLYDALEVTSPLVAGEHLALFNQLGEQQKAERLAGYIMKCAEERIIPLFIDNGGGGVLNDDGDYQEYIGRILPLLAAISRPTLCFIQTRMMRYTHKLRYPRAFHIRLPSLADETVYELMCLKLKDRDIDFREDEVREACKLTDGHPLNIDFLVRYIAEEGLDVMLADPAEVIEIKAKRGLEFLRRISFNAAEKDVLCVLHDYRFCELEMLLYALEAKTQEIAEAVRKLEDFCCIERCDRMLSVSPHIRDAIIRDQRFTRDNGWRGEVAGRVVKAIEAYVESESLSIAFIDSAIPELLRRGVEVPFVSHMILPSHFLRVARDYYNKRAVNKRALKSCIEFCNKALDSESILTGDARVEANRLLGLALTRDDQDDPRIDEVVRRLRGYATATARRVAYFIEGLRSRYRGDYDIAEKNFRDAHDISPKHNHINRELSHVLCRMGRYPEAEPYARAAYDGDPNNPYIVDVLVEVLEGKRTQGLAVKTEELNALSEALRKMCEQGGLSFYRVREARKAFAQQHGVKAFDTIGACVNVEPEDALLYYHRCRMYIKTGSVREARQDIQELRKRGREYVSYANELEAECLIAEGRFPEAKELIDHRFKNARYISDDLQKKLARAVAYAPEGAPGWLRKWAKQAGGG